MPLEPDSTQPLRPPTRLSKRARDLWKELSPEIGTEPQRLELLTEACRALTRVDQLDRVIAKDGITSRGSTGQTVVHPAIAEQRQQQAAYASLMERLKLPIDERTRAIERSQRARRAANARHSVPQVIPITDAGSIRQTRRLRGTP
jgi:P27 family predicted phage terminase small subunit